jgi:hypothetical protein
MNHSLFMFTFRRLLAVAMLAQVPSAFAAICNSTGSGNWNAAIWSCAGGPGVNDDVVINNGHVVTLNVNTANLASVTINNGGTLRGDGTGKILTASKGGGSDLVNNGTLNFSGANAAIVHLVNNKDGQWGGTGTWNLSVLDLSGRALTFVAGTTATLNFSGAAVPIINPGTVTSLTTITWNFSGTTAQTLPASASVQYGKLNISNTAGVTMGVALSSANTLDTLTVATNGIFNNAGFAITLAANKNFSVQNGATFNLTGTSTMAAVSGSGTKTFGATSTVNYAGTNQNVTAETYGHLTLSGSGTKTPAAGTTTVAGDFTLSSGVTYAGTTNNPSVQFAGNFSNSGTFTSGTGTYTFNGGGAQSLTGATTFTSLTMNNTGSGLTLNNNITVTTAAAGTLTFTSGIITTGSNRVIVTRACNAPSVSRSGIGHVAGFLQKTIPAGSTSCTFEVGATTTYRPIDTTWTSVTTSGSVTGSVIQSAGEHPNIATSQIDPNLDVNRWWTLTNSGTVFTNYSATFNFVAGDLDSGASTSSFIIQLWNGSAWSAPTLGTLASTSSQATGLTGFGDFAIGQGGVNHFSITDSGTGVNCQAEAVTIAAHRSDHSVVTTLTGTITISTSTAHGDWTLNAGSGTFTPGAANSGNATYTFVAADNGQVVLNLRDTFAETVNINVTNGNVTEASGNATASDDQNIVFSAGALRFVDGSSNPTITNQVAGQTSGTFYLQVIKNGTTTAACTGAFGAGQTANIELASECVNPAACSSVKLNFTNNATTTAIANNNGGSVSSYTTVPVTFLNDGTSRAAFTFSLADVGQIKLYGRYNVPLQNGSASGNLISGSSNAFVVKPGGFVLSAIHCTTVNAANCAPANGTGNNPAAGDATGSAFIQAGKAFSATVTATTIGGAATPNYGKESPAETVKLTANLVAGLGLTNNPVLGNTTAFGAFTSGVATGTTFSWGDVGVITLTPSVGDGDYLGTGDINGTTSGNVGRFIPDHFDVSLNTPQFTSTCSSFTYIGQPFVYTATVPVITVTARNAAGTTAQNYKGTSPASQAWWKITNGSLTGKAYSIGSGTLDTTGLPGTDPVIAAAGNGTGTLTFGSGTGISVLRSTPIAPFDAEISLAINVIDGDQIAYASNPAQFGLTTTGNGIGFSTGKQMRFGRLRLNNAFGSSLLDLPLPLSTQYYDGSFFVTNIADSCTTLAASDIAFNFVGPNLAACETHLNPAGTLGFTSGKAGVKLAKPGNSKNGAVDLTLNLGASASGNTCTSSTTGVSATTANKTWLQGNWGSGTYVDNPRGRATFGIFKNADQFLYFREVY